MARRPPTCTETAFIVGWAIVIIAVGAWAARTNRRWVVTTAAVFGAIEFYTQWFEWLGAEPWAIIIGGLTVVAFAIVVVAVQSHGRSPRDGHRLSQKPGLNTGASRVAACIKTITDRNFTPEAPATRFARPPIRAFA